ncbi:putative patatin/cPLA2 family phospholipase [Breznakibacter xylanolyticus]|uniref:Putative patatin/cPLA2 family phospholipase n=1 Tax=Breznakibacter xylanolyticus TaxID=990 RepID=A0A2W7NG64_9BACT|nr:patatin family protein [Breznakibacter xylanolyticus]PZX19385.1 putative patatin/cPLA2 family phospholipase [Breznakibacter xylanolyticus]
MIQTNSIALVLEGGGFRGMFTAGILDVLIHENIFFNYIIAVSAGAACGISYVTKQAGRSLEQNKYIRDKRYCSLTHLVKHGSYFNWDFIFHTIPTQLVPLDYGMMNNQQSRMKVVVSNIITGQPEYIEISLQSPQIIKELLTATSSLPIISKPCQINKYLYMDGGLTDSIPIRHALEDGNQRAVVILTREKGYRKKSMKLAFVLRFMYHKYPKLVEMMLNRVHQYNQSLDLIDQLEREGKIFVIRPENPIPVSRLENNPENLHKAHHEAIIQMKHTLSSLQKWLHSTEHKTIDILELE